ncbi:MAG: hypothetical protein COT71_04245 [Candidatus Andersenbacteria bacterium CG10_big_fil_rev_8_21_14_0_10_54_11]|uniref:YqeG family HAD IIIA-type phosphatase n=1 Tax=Candidatus Andersenbacteria bacterium CG10_big_fil_rev_8_21_14_0_10_54_11 TaxID=1974485 RepID=A0A2M6WYA5_9BACT|nr:MAG: hypothetical protein COT71_04245 [Candidatus Andersenbacteria bacterium CG10_big_fil_rev_8_21_14_0_10_54_11]
MRKLLVPREHLAGRSLWRQRAWYAPHYVANSLLEVDFTVLRERGVRCAALDVDNTLVSHGGMNMTPEVIALLRQVREKGVLERLVLATNRCRSVDQLAAHIRADAVLQHGWHRKPSRRYFDQLERAVQFPPEAIAMIGDKIWTDIYGANRAGMVTVLVRPLGGASVV